MSTDSSTVKTQPEPIREPQSDHLLTPQNSVIALIDYQSTQYNTVTSATTEEINLGAVTLAKLAHTYKIPTIVSTVAVGLGVNQPTVSEIVNELPGVTEIDRTGVNAWEDEDFRRAIEATGKKKVIIAGLWTEVCVSFPTLDMLKAGYEVYPVIDAIAGVTPVSHESAVTRMVQAGAHPVTSLALGAELMRNWARSDSGLYREILVDYLARKQAITDGK